MNRFSKRPFELSPNKRALLEMTLQQEGIEAAAIPHISRRQESDSLSFAQQRLWFLDQWGPARPIYNIARAFSLLGELNVAALERSFHEVVQRHEALRTTFALRENKPIQVIVPTLPDILSFVDLTELAEDERDVRAQQLAREEAQRPFDLARGPLVRVYLLRYSTQQHMLLLTIHHIICDGWSLHILLRELGILYQAYVAGQSSPLEELSLQYADYTLWQGMYLQGETLEAHLTYWQRQLLGAATVLDLPTDHPRPPLQTFRGAHLLHDLTRELAMALEELSQREGVSLFMTLLAAFAILLTRYSGQEDLLIGTLSANRPQRALQDVIGCFANTLALRLDVSGQPGFRALLARVRDVCLEAYAHQDLPFEKLVEALVPERALSHTPLLQVLFTLQQTPLDVLHVPGLSVGAPEIIATGTARMDLMLTAIEMHEGVRLDFEYSTDLFEAATIARMAQHLQRLLEAIVAAPEQRPWELTLLGEAERHLLLHGWNATRQSYAQQANLPQLVEAQVARTPDAIALVWGEQQLTYHELNRRANQLAHHLLGRGVGPEQLVAICLPRGLDLVIALLAILKTGGAYLPLDPSYPAERLAMMLQDSQACLLLAQLGTESLLQPPCPLLTVSLAALSSKPEENPGCPALAEHLAYVIYTSGSTGRPKGVALTHSSACALLCWASLHFSRKQLARVLASTSICFDLSVFEIWGPLCAGGMVLLAEDILRAFPWAAEQAVTLLNTVPSALTALLALRDLPTSVSVVNLAGEPLGAHLAQQTYARGAVQQVYNLYGPTEDTTYSTWARLAPGTGDPLPIGRPIANTEAYLLDAQGQPVPIGAVGELYLGGAGLARGYLRQPALTAERFVPHPFSKQPGQRLYRTGDLARYRPDGSLVFVGRVDNQVKLHGYRIEPGEIEAELRQHPLVRDAVVVLGEDAGGEKRLVGYVVPQEQPLAQHELHGWLAGQLPDYMIPTAWVVLERLPLSPNGKVDRGALPAPGRLGLEMRASYSAPRTPVEELLVGIWMEVLGLERIGIYDNFFEMGGHSLLATQVVARLRETVQREIPLHTLFEAPTVAQLAQRLARTLLEESHWSAPPLRSCPRPATLPLAFAQQRLWFLDQLEPATPAYNMAMPIRLSGMLQVSALEQALGDITKRHDILRTCFVIHNSSPIQRISPFLPLTLAVVDLSALSLAQRETLALQLASEETHLPFDLARGPLLRVKLLRLEAEEHVLLLTMHHIIVDGWSLEVLLRELSLHYQALVQGQPSPLPQLPVQYADYTLWQREYLQGALLETQVAYWKQHLRGAPPRLDLPTDRPRPAVQTIAGAHHRFTLSQELSNALAVLSRREGVTLFMTLLAAFATLLWRYSGQEDLLIGTPIANRIHPQLEDLIGCFVNTLVLRADLSGDPSFRTFLRRVRKETLQAYAHQDVPFEQVVEALQPLRDLSHAPLFQVMFVLQNAPRESIELPGLRLRPLVVEQTTARFDLTLVVQETTQGLEVAVTAAHEQRPSPGQLPLEGMLEYNTDLFETATMARMARQWQRLLEGIVADAELPLSRLPLLTTEEQRRVLALCNPVLEASEREFCLHELFEAQVERAPHAIALVWEDAQLSYQQLNACANTLAHHLQACGVGPHVRVGLCLERSIEMIIGLLAILKAGGVYVPLDPTYPAERLSFMLVDAQISVLLTQERLRERLPATDVLVLCLSSERDALPGRNANPMSGVTARHLAYMIYTSGSTGRPKGALVPHRGVYNLAEAQMRAFATRPGDRILQFASLSFDASIWEIVMALCVGATLCLAAREALLPGSAFVKLLQEQAITIMTLPPSVLSALPTRAFPALHTIITAGEACSSELVATWAVDHRFFNAYGPTETTVCATLCECHDSDRKPPIGRPIAHTQVYVLDAHLQPVPVGVPGELYIGGDGVGWGYFHRPELTAERFIPDPWSRVQGARLYKTGDLVRCLPDGTLEFVGRLDQQVKLWGNRIELGEIEAVLAAHPAVREAVVVVRGEGHDDKRLVAYIVPHPQQPTVSELQAYLQSRLPGYMLPAIFMFLEALPRSPNGKLDRRGLPVPDRARPELEKQYVAPRTPVEEILVSIWSQVLGLERVGIHDHFFELGGHSLLATQVISRVRDAFKVEVPLYALFGAPSVAGLAEALVRHEAVAGQVAAIARLRKKIEDMSPDEMRRALHDKTKGRRS